MWWRPYRNSMARRSIVSALRNCFSKFVDRYQFWVFLCKKSSNFLAWLNRFCISIACMFKYCLYICLYAHWFWEYAVSKLVFLVWDNENCYSLMRVKQCWASAIKNLFVPTCGLTWFKVKKTKIVQWYLLSHDNRSFSISYKINTVKHTCAFSVTSAVVQMYISHRHNQGDHEDEYPLAVWKKNEKNKKISTVNSTLEFGHRD